MAVEVRDDDGLGVVLGRGTEVGGVLDVELGGMLDVELGRMLDVELGGASEGVEEGRVELELELDRELGGTGGRTVLVLGGVERVGLGGVERVGLGGLVPPLVGVSTWLPSQYIVRPVRASSLSTVLIPLVPGPVQYTELACETFSGLGYSMWKTGFPEARKLL
jgi:hypothetical protein